MECEICGSHYGVQEHHIIHGRGKRKALERKESLIYLCWDHHHGNYGVHGKHGKALDTKLKLGLQLKYFGMGYSQAEVMLWMGGKLLLVDGEVYGSGEDKEQGEGA